MHKHRKYLFNIVAVTWLISGCAGPAAFRTDDIPDPLRAPGSQLLTVQARAKGVQMYRCKPAKDDATRFEWVFVAPEAILVDQTGKKIAKHYAGPTWEALDGSTVVGQVVAKSNSPDGHSIAWLLLSAKAASGTGQFGSVASIQRLHTSGGDAPSSCQAQQEDKQLRVPYTADYFFYVGAR